MFLSDTESTFLVLFPIDTKRVLVDVVLSRNLSFELHRYHWGRPRIENLIFGFSPEGTLIDFKSIFLTKTLDPLANLL